MEHITGVARSDEIGNMPGSIYIKDFCPYRYQLRDRYVLVQMLKDWRGTC